MRTFIAAPAALALASALFATAGLSPGCARQSSGPGEIAVAVTENGFEPAVARVPRGKPVTLIVTRHTDKTCATDMVFEGTGQRYELPLGKPVRIDLAAGVSDTLRYACGMEMYTGMIVAK